MLWNMSCVFIYHPFWRDFCHGFFITHSDVIFVVMVSSSPILTWFLAGKRTVVCNIHTVAFFLKLTDDDVSPHNRYLVIHHVHVILLKVDTDNMLHILDIYVSSGGFRRKTFLTTIALSANLPTCFIYTCYVMYMISFDVDLLWQQLHSIALSANLYTLMLNEVDAEDTLHSCYYVWSFST